MCTLDVNGMCGVWIEANANDDDDDDDDDYGKYNSLTWVDN